MYNLINLYLILAPHQLDLTVKFDPSTDGNKDNKGDTIPDNVNGLPQLIPKLKPDTPKEPVHDDEINPPVTVPQPTPNPPVPVEEVNKLGEPANPKPSLTPDPKLEPPPQPPDQPQPVPSEPLKIPDHKEEVPNPLPQTKSEWDECEFFFCFFLFNHTP